MYTDPLNNKVSGVPPMNRTRNEQLLKAAKDYRSSLDLMSAEADALSSDLQKHHGLRAKDPLVNGLRALIDIEGYRTELVWNIDQAHHVPTHSNSYMLGSYLAAMVKSYGEFLHFYHDAVATYRDTPVSQSENGKAVLQRIDGALQTIEDHRRRALTDFPHLANAMSR